jgi:hypothetical protein
LPADRDRLYPTTIAGSKQLMANNERLELQAYGPAPFAG